MKDLKAIILTEAGKDYGLGHLSRMTAIYEALCKVNINTDIFVKGSRISYNYPNLRYKILDWINNSNFLQKISNFDIVIIDSYLASLDLLKTISKKVKICVYFDDFKRLDYPKGIIVNFAFIAEELFKDKKNENIYLLGNKYVPIREKLIQGKKNKKDKNLISIFIRGIEKKDFCKDLEYLIHKFFPEKHIVKFCGNYRIDIYKYIDILNQSFFSISTAGMTMHEIAFMEIPTIPLIVSENQNTGYLKFGFVEKYINISSRNFLKEIEVYLQNLKTNYSKYQKMAQKGQEIVDGKGAERIVKEILRVYEEDFVNRR